MINRQIAVCTVSVANAVDCLVQEARCHPMNDLAQSYPVCGMELFPDATRMELLCSPTDCVLAMEL